MELFLKHIKMVYYICNYVRTIENYQKVDRNYQHLYSWLRDVSAENKKLFKNSQNFGLMVITSCIELFDNYKIPQLKLFSEVGAMEN